MNLQILEIFSKVALDVATMEIMSIWQSQNSVENLLTRGVRFLNIKSKSRKEIIAQVDTGYYIT